MWSVWATRCHLPMWRRVCESGKSRVFIVQSQPLTIQNRVDQVTYKIMLPLPPKIDPSVTMMQVEERPSITYADVGGCKEQIEKLREVVELPLLEVSGKLFVSGR